MAKENKSVEATAVETTNAEKQFAIQKIYTKDISFETPSSPKIFTLTWEPQVDLKLGTNVTLLEEQIFEVSLTVTVTVKCGETVAYLAEVCQAGLFTLGGFSDQEKGHMVGSFCPNILYPYAREVISDLVAKGGFPQMLLTPINFDALYAQHLQQAEQTQAAPQHAPSTDTIN